MFNTTVLTEGSVSRRTLRWCGLAKNLGDDAEITNSRTTLPLDSF
jgi:hypothetical protein